MKTSPVIHGSFTIERNYAAPPERVFAAWADPGTKARWFAGPAGKWREIKREHDFRVGGTEILHGEHTGKFVSLFVARYHAIVPNERLVYVYDMHVGDSHMSVSISTVEIIPDGRGTKMVYSEQIAFLDGEDGTRSREMGTHALLNRFGEVLGD